jgi:hypothetical protein
MFRRLECDQILERSSVSPRRGPATYVGRTRAIVLVILGGICFVSVMLFSQRAKAEAYVSTQSGSWNDSNTWGGAGVPDSSDDVVISSGHTVTLGATCFSRNLTISSGGTLDLNGQQFNFPTNGATFTNNGLLTNTGVVKSFYFLGNGAPGAVTQSLGGAGTYGGNVTLQLHSSVTVNVVASTSLAFASATNNTGLLVDAGSTLSFASVFDFTAPSSGSNYVGILNNGVLNGGLLRTQGNVEIVGDATIVSPVEIASGAQKGSGSFSGDFTIESAASFKLTNTLLPYGNLTILDGATLDLNERQVNFLGNNKTFTNNGTLTNTGAINTFYLHGNFNPGGVTQNVAGAGNYDSNVRLRLYASVMVNVSSGTVFSGLLHLWVESGSTLNLPNPLTFTGPTSGPTFATITNYGSISGNGGLNTQGQVQIVSDGAFDTPLEVVNGTTQTAGSFVNGIAVDNTGTLKLTGTINHTADLSIRSGGTLDLNGKQINFRGDGATFTNNGLMTNTGVVNRFYFHGNGIPGAVTQGFGGVGTYSGNLILNLYNRVTVNIAALTSLTFNSASNNTNLEVDSGSTLSLANALNFAGPAAGADYVGILSNGTISGGGGLKTHGNVQLFGGAAIGAPVEIASGSQKGQGSFSGAFTIDNGASFKLTNILSLSGDLTILGGATMDLNAWQVNFLGNGTSFTNNGLLTNTGAGNNFYFHGNGTPGAIAQTLQGTGAFTGNVQTRLYNVVSVTLGSDAQLAVLGIDAGSTLDITNHMLKLSGAGTPMTASGTLITTGSTIAYNGTAAQTVATANVNYNSLMIDNPAGVTLGSAEVIPEDATLTLKQGVFNNGGNLTLGDWVLISRSNGSLAAAPTFGIGVNVEYTGSSPITTALEIPADPGKLDDLTVLTSSTVSLSGDTTVNLTLSLTSGSLSIGAHTLTIKGQISAGGGSLIGGPTSNMIFEETPPSTALPAVGLNNLTINRSSGIILGGDVTVDGQLALTGGALSIGAHTLTINGAITPSGGGLTGSGSSNIIFGGAGATTSLPSVTLNDLTINRASGISLGGGATIGGALTLTTGTLANGANLSISSGATIRRDGGGLSTVPTFGASVNIEYLGTVAVTTGVEIPASASVLDNFTDNKAGTVTLGGNATVNGTLALNSGSLAVGANTLTLNNGASAAGGTLTSDATGTVNYSQASNGQNVLAGGYGNLTFSNFNKALASSGIIRVAGVFNPGTATGHAIAGSSVEYNGGLAQSLPASFSSYDNLTINNNAGVTLVGDVSVSGALLLTSGTVVTNANTLTLGNAASSNRTSGSVIGNLKKSFAGPSAFTYVVGTANGYSPVNASVTGGAGELTITAVQGPQPNVEIPTRALQRYWRLAGAGITTNLTFNYIDSEDVPPTANESAFHLYKYSGLFTDLGAAGLDASNDQYTITGVSSFSDWTLAEVGAPTEITFAGFVATGVVDAKGRDAGTLLEWETGMEVSNLGFYIHREEGGKFNRITTDLIAGSALFAGARVVLTSGRSYSWLDPNPVGPDTRFWLEEVDLSGACRMYGPFFVAASKATEASLARRGNSALISEVGQRRDNEDQRTRPVEAVAQTPRLGETQTQSSAKAISQVTPPAVKLGVTHEGWYRVTQPALVRAGVDPNVDPRLLQLSADGVEQPIKVTGEQDGVFDPDDAIEFYGIGINSPYSATRAYWITVGAQAGRRIAEIEGAAGSAAASSFPYTVERRDRTVYFSGLRNGDRENFFGAVVSSNEVNQTLTATRIAREPGAMAELEVALQGVTAGPHLARVQLNGVELEQVSFSGQGRGVKKISITESMLSEGQNVVTLTALGGDGDVSLVDYLRLTYPRTRVADNDWLASTAWANQRVTVDGFSNDQIRVVDVTNANEPVELKARVVRAGSSYSAVVSTEGEGERRLLAFTTQRVEEVSATARQLSNWKDYSEGADYVIITRREFVDSLKPLAALRQSNGLRVAMIDVEDLYDEFNYGQKTPYAVREFLAHARAGWKKSPRYVLLAGDASYDPKNYLDFGDSDLVPTKLIDTTYLETASDDWFADWNGDGAAEIAIGRLPFRASFEADVIVSKIIGYERTASSQKALLIADNNDGFDFEKATDQLLAYLPANIKPQQIYRGRLDPPAAKTQLLEAINRGQKIVNYMGHGSTNQWRGSLFTGDDARALTNANRLPFFVMMTCLNGYFHDPAMDSLSESLVRAEHGGAIAVWASTGLTLPEAQSVINQKLFSLIFEKRLKGQPLTIGEAAILAKPAVNDTFVRSTWNLIGDPATRLR